MNSLRNDQCAIARARPRNTQPRRPVGGFSIVEVVLAAAMVSMFFTGVAAYFVKAVKVAEQTTRYIQSSFLLEESVEVVKGLRDAGWAANITTLATGTPYYLYWDGAKWSATTTKYLVENY